MTIETLLWATPINEPEYMEVLITNNASLIPAARLWAEANGFDRFRISTFDPSEAPNFENVINH